MKKGILGYLLLVISTHTFASVDCPGKINSVYKWSEMTSVSVQIKLASGQVTPWINMPTPSDEAMALMAFSANKPVHFHWSDTTITSCIAGAEGTWPNNTPLSGYFSVTK